MALTPKYKLPIKRGPILKNHQIGKLAQQDILRKHGIGTPPALPFSFGMTLDPTTFGEFVVVKTMDLKLTSHGNLVFLFRRERLCSLKQQDLPRDHPINRDPRSFLVQKYIRTGMHPRHIRVGTFFGKAIFCYVSNQYGNSLNRTPQMMCLSDRQWLPISESECGDWCSKKMLFNWQKLFIERLNRSRY